MVYHGLSQRKQEKGTVDRWCVRVVKGLRPTRTFSGTRDYDSQKPSQEQGLRPVKTFSGKSDPGGIRTHPLLNKDLQDRPGSQKYTNHTPLYSHPLPTIGDRRSAMCEKFRSTGERKHQVVSEDFISPLSTVPTRVDGRVGQVVSFHRERGFLRDSPV